MITQGKQQIPTKTKEKQLLSWVCACLCEALAHNNKGTRKNGNGNQRKTEEMQRRPKETKKTSTININKFTENNEYKQ